MMKNIIKIPYKKLKAAFNKNLNRIYRPIIILLYHRVTNLSSDPQLLSVSPQNFRQQINYLKDNFQILRFEDDWKYVDKPSIVITFDDGYADNYLEALPILEELKVPATIFLSSGLIGTQNEYWWDELERIILVKSSNNKCFKLEYNGVKYKWYTCSFEQRKTMYDELHPILKSVNAEKRESYLNELRTWSETDSVGRTTHTILTIEELINLSKSSYITIGAHTVTHSALSCLSAQEQEYEIEKSKKDLEDIIKKSVNVFSYPFGGRKDYNKNSTSILRKLNINKAASNFPGQWRKWTDPYQIPRHIVRNWDIDEFEKRLERFWYI